MAYQGNQGTGGSGGGFDREREEDFRRGSGKQEGYGGGSYGSSERGREEFGRNRNIEEYKEQGGDLYGQGRREEESWRPGQSTGSTERGSYGREFQGYGSQQGRRAVAGGFGSSEGSEGFGGGTQGYAGSYGYGRESQRFGSVSPTRGRFTGKGPKGYTRSDERIKEDVSDKLEQHGDIDASNIEVRVEKGEVTLEGSVEDRFTKRLAEDVAEECPGVKEVDNRLRVKKGDGGGGFEGGREKKSSSTASSSSPTKS